MSYSTLFKRPAPSTPRPGVSLPVFPPSCWLCSGGAGDVTMTHFPGRTRGRALPPVAYCRRDEFYMVNDGASRVPRTPGRKRHLAAAPRRHIFRLSVFLRMAAYTFWPTGLRPLIAPQGSGAGGHPLDGVLLASMRSANARCSWDGYPLTIGQAHTIAPSRVLLFETECHRLRFSYLFRFVCRSRRRPRPNDATGQSPRAAVGRPAGGVDPHSPAPSSTRCSTSQVRRTTCMDLGSGTASPSLVRETRRACHRHRSKPRHGRAVEMPPPPRA